MNVNIKTGSKMKEKVLKTQKQHTETEEIQTVAIDEYVLKDSKTVVFTSLTGGSGCSFIVNSTAAYFAKNKNINILLLDMQSGKKDSRVIFKISGDFTRDLGDILCDFSDIDAGILKKLVINLNNSLNIILPSLKFEKMEMVSNGKLEELLEVLSGYFDLVFVDLPFYHFFGSEHNLTDKVDKIVFISQADYISVVNLENFISNFSCENASLKFELLVNKFNLKTVISPARIMNTVRFPVKTFIPYDRDIEYLYLERGPFVVFDYSLRTVKALRDFADMLYEDIYI